MPPQVTEKRLGCWTFCPHLQDAIWRLNQQEWNRESERAQNCLVVVLAFGLGLMLGLLLLLFLR